MNNPIPKIFAALAIMLVTVTFVQDNFLILGAAASFLGLSSHSAIAPSATALVDEIDPEKTQPPQELKNFPEQETLIAFAENDSSNIIPNVSSNTAEKNETHSCCKTSHYFNPCSDTKRGELLLKGELLYWKGELCGLEGAFGNTTIETTSNGTTIKESDREPDFKWKSGFRVGADLLFHCLGLEVDWTHFPGHANFTDDKQHGRWKLQYDVIDLTLGYKFYPCSRFYVKPFIGLRNAMIHQTLKSHLETLLIDPPAKSIAITNMHNKEDFWGLGPQIGLEAAWYVGRNFSLYCTIDAVNYYGHVDGKFHDVDTLTKAVNVNKLHKRDCFNTFGTDGTIGIRWDKYEHRSKCDMHFMLKLGLEQHRIYDFSNMGSDGSLSLDGGVLEAGVGFLF